MDQSLGREDILGKHNGAVSGGDILSTPMGNSFGGNISG